MQYSTDPVCNTPLLLAPCSLHFQHVTEKCKTLPKAKVKRHKWSVAECIAYTLERERFAADWQKRGWTRKKALCRFRTQKKVQKAQERRFFRRVVYYYENLPEHGQIQKTKDRKRSLGGGRKTTTLTPEMEQYFSNLVEVCRGPPPALVKLKAKLNKRVLDLAQQGLRENPRKKTGILQESRSVIDLTEPTSVEVPDGDLDEEFREAVFTPPVSQQAEDDLDAIFNPSPQVEPKKRKRTEVPEEVEQPKRLDKPPKKRRKKTGTGARDSPLELDQTERSQPPSAMQAEVISNTASDEFDWSEAFVLLESKRDGSPVKLTYRQLVLQVKQNWPVVYKTRTIGAWYQAVRRWCVKNGLVLRKTNFSSPAKPSVVASEIRLFRKEFRDAIVDGNLELFEIANLDETSIQIFTEMVETLHYKGAKRVPGEKTDRSRVYLNVSCIWWADGRLDFVVIYRSEAQDVKEKPTWERLGNGAGVYWLKAASKWTTKKVYTEVVKALVGMKCKLFSDDHAPSHDDPAVDHFLKTMEALRVRVPKNATSLAQPGDRPGCNQTLKRILNEVILDKQLRALLEADFAESKIKASMSAESRLAVSNVLVEVKNRMNRDHGEDIRKSFRETCLPEERKGKMHSVLKEFLDRNPEPLLPPQPTIPDNAFACAYGCGAWWKTAASQKRHHETYCWNRRPYLCTPVPRRSVRKLNAPWTPGLVGTVELYRQGHAPKSVRVFLGDERHFSLETLKVAWYAGSKRDPWWWRCGKVLWREATPEEKVLAKERQWLA